MTVRRFEDLRIWRLSLGVTKCIYDLTSKKQFSDYGLVNQMRRAVVSISSNIVEGFEKNNNNELIRYLKIAKGSAGELRNQLYISKEVGYCSNLEFVSLTEKIIIVSKQISSFISYLQTKRNNKEFKNK